MKRFADLGNCLLPAGRGTNHRRDDSGPGWGAERAAIAVVDPAGDLLAFQRMDDVRSASADLAIQKPRTAAPLPRPTAEIEDNINQGRTALVTARIMALRGGMPVRVDGEVVGAVGVAGLSNEPTPRSRGPRQQP